MRRRWQLFQRGLDPGRQAAQGLELGFVTGQLSDGRQLAVDQQVSDFLELAGGGDIKNVIATVMQIIAAATYGAQRGVTGGSAAQGNGLLRFERRRGGVVGAPSSYPYRPSL